MRREGEKEDNDKQVPFSPLAIFRNHASPSQSSIDVETKRFDLTTKSHHPQIAQNILTAIQAEKRKISHVAHQ